MTHRPSTSQLSPEKHRGAEVLHTCQCTIHGHKKANTLYAQGCSFTHIQKLKLFAWKLQFYNVCPILVTRVDRLTNTHTCKSAYTHTVTYTLLHGYVQASVPSNKAERGQWGLMLVQLEHLMQRLSKFPFPWSFHTHLFTSTKSVMCLCSHFQNHLT